MLFSPSTLCALLTSGALLSSCASVEESTATATTEDTLISNTEIIQHEIETIYQDALYVNDAPLVTPGGVVITSASEWKELLGKMNTNKEVSLELGGQEINFEQEMIIAYFDQIRGSKNTTVTIESVTEKLQGLFVNYSVISNDSDPAAEVMNQPCMLVRIKKRNKKAVFSPTF